jgi:hypothetical protein
MVSYWKLLGEYDAETTTFTAFAGGAGASPYTPTKDAMLKGLRALVGADAATTLTEGVQFRLTCDTFDPNSIECGAQGSGLATVPALRAQQMYDWPIDQEVKAGVPITLEGRNITADTPVGVSVSLYGYFEA